MRICSPSTSQRTSTVLELSNSPLSTTVMGNSDRTTVAVISTGNDLLLRASKTMPALTSTIVPTAISFQKSPRPADRSLAGGAVLDISLPTRDIPELSWYSTFKDHEI